MKKAICTICIGSKYQKLFNLYYLSSWKHYCKAHGFDLIIIDKVLDTSERSKKRSISWQKCLILNHPDVAKYDTVVWIDADIVINSKAPDITLNVPVGKIGAVDMFSSPTQAEYDAIRLRYNQKLLAMGLNECLLPQTPNEYHSSWGLPVHQVNMESVVQTGVLVLNPGIHSEFLQRVYDTYEDKGLSKWHYEMRPLSYEIQKQLLFHRLDYRFNIIWHEQLWYHYPFLENYIPPCTVEKVLRKITFHKYRTRFQSLLHHCAVSVYDKSFFLHFAGAHEDVHYLFR